VRPPPGNGLERVEGILAVGEDVRLDPCEVALAHPAELELDAARVRHDLEEPAHVALVEREGVGVEVREQRLRAQPDEARADLVAQPEDAVDRRPQLRARVRTRLVRLHDGADRARHAREALLESSGVRRRARGVQAVQRLAQKLPAAREPVQRAAAHRIAQNPRPPRGELHPLERRVVVQRLLLEIWERWLHLRQRRRERLLDLGRRAVPRADHPDLRDNSVDAPLRIDDNQYRRNVAAKGAVVVGERAREDRHRGVPLQAEGMHRPELRAPAHPQGG